MDQGINFSEAKPHIFSGTIEDRTDASFYLEPTLSLEGPLPLTFSVHAYHWPVDFPSSVGENNRLSFLMNQSTGQVLESPAARNCQGEPFQGQAGGDHMKPAAGCAPSALFVARTTRGMTWEKPGSDQSRPKVWKAQPTAEFSMSLLKGDPQPLHFFCTCSFTSKTFNFSKNICSLCFPSSVKILHLFKSLKQEFSKKFFSLRRFHFPPVFINQEKTQPYGRN